MCLMAAAPGSGQRAPELGYQLTEGQNLNAFVRDGKVAAHLLLRSGADPRILVAFPAGNSGVGLWFDRTAAPVVWRLEGAPQPVTLADGRGRPLYGIRAVASLATPRLAVKQAVLSNVRFLRDYQAVGKFPAEVAAPMQVEGDRISYARDRVDSAPGYRLELRVIEGRIDKRGIAAGASGRIRLEIVAASGDTPLTGLTLPELFNDRAADDPASRNALHFLSYREKFLAGSWRFNTYFGRDTLMSVRLLMPVLQPAAIEAGLGAVLARLDEAGEVAHEEGLSEFAILDRRHHGGSGDAPTLDYAMIDDDFMLAPVAAHYLLEQAQPAAARAFLARDIPSETKPGSAARAGTTLVRNLRFVLEQARPFAEAPGVARLVALKPGRTAGQWRDSGDGIGGGRYPYDVNAVFVPAALDAAARLFRAGLLDPYLTADDRAAFGRAGMMAELWRSRVPGLFRVSVPAVRAVPMIRTYAAGFGVPAQPALAALGKTPLTFHAIALDAAGAPVPILNSDEGFALLFGDPAPADLDIFVGAILRPFPAGLMTDIGLLVANPVLAPPEMRARFTPAAYHGTVVWSWQQALLAAGLERQLARSDLPAATRGRLRQAQARLWRAISATRALQSSELWSWAYEGGRYRMVPFGAGRQDVDESNAAQLWSTVYLAVRPPAAAP
jgi:glycogen debranching enzyme